MPPVSELTYINLLLGVIVIAVGTKPSLYAELGVVARVSVEVAAVVLVAAVVVVVSEKPAMLGGDVEVLLEFATYMKFVEIVQFEVHLLSGGKNPHPVSPAVSGASSNAAAHIVFHPLNVITLPERPLSVTAYRRKRFAVPQAGSLWSQTHRRACPPLSSPAGSSAIPRRAVTNI
jgi:hypothetical protein